MSPRGDEENEWKIETHLSSNFWKIFSKKVLTQNTDDDKIVNVAERQTRKNDLWKLNRGN